MAEPSLNLGNGNWAVKSNNLLAYHKVVDNFYADELTFTRASTGTRVNADGLIEEAATNIARVDYTNNASGQLLLEPQRTNQITQSSDFSNSYWNKQAIIETSSETSPSGGSAYNLVETATTTYQYIFHQNASVTLSTDYVFSCFVKSIDAQYFQLTMYNGGVYGSANFDLTNKTYNTSVSGGYVVSSANIEEYANGWLRVSMVFQSTSTTTPTIALCLANSSGAGYIPLYLGTSRKVAIYGAMLEEGSYETSLIPTSGTTVTRIKDTSSTTGLSSVIGQTEGTLFFKIKMLSNTDDVYNFFRITSSATPSNYLYLRIKPSTSSIAVIGGNTTGTQIVMTHTILTSLELTTSFAIKYKSNDCALWINGVEIATDLSANMFADVVDTFDLGINGFRGDLEDMIFYPIALTDTELETLTTL